MIMKAYCYSLVTEPSQESNTLTPSQGPNFPWKITRVKRCDFYLVLSLPVPFDEDAASKIMPKKVCADSQPGLSSFSVAWGQNRLQHSCDPVFCNSLFHTLAH